MIDSAVRAFQEFQKKYEDFKQKDLTESDTRSKILDHILINILGWSEIEISREGYVEGGMFYDYMITIPSFQFVIEAKRNFEHFQLPINKTCKIGTLLKGNASVITQIRNYLIGKNLMYGIITNGSQFIIGKFVNTDGSDWKENICILLHSIDFIDKNFVSFYNLISSEAVKNNGRIKINNEEIKGRTILESLSGKEGRLNRNIFSAPLFPIIQSFFTEMFIEGEDSNNKFLAECYVKNEDINKYSEELNILFDDIAPNFDERIAGVRNTDNTIKQLKDSINDGIRNVPDPILLIGGKGVGKTTFINYFLRVVLDSEKKKDRLIVYLDFKNYTGQQIYDTQRIYKEIIDKLTDKYPALNLTKRNILEKIYSKEIKQKKEGVWDIFKDDTLEINKKIAEYLDKQSEDHISHLKKVTDYLIYTCHKRLCIIFDNGDQLATDIQGKVYLLAQSIHMATKSIILVSLREGYFYKLRNKPPFDAFRTTVFHISAPLYSEVIKRRIKYLLDNYGFPKKVIEDKVQYSGSTLKNLFLSFYHTLFERGNSEILDHLEKTSYPNIRLGLDKLNEFLISAHTQIQQYITTEDYNIPIWEFVKSVALGSRLYYDHTDSKIYNLFYPCEGNRNHFTKIRLLLFIQNKLSKEKRYLVCSEILEVFNKAGYTNDIILKELSILFSYKLIENDFYSSDVDTDYNVENSTNLRITHSGNYYLQMICTFHYFELVLQDTPIYSDSFYNKMISTFPYSDKEGNKDLVKRLRIVEAFFDYLNEEEKRDHTANEFVGYESALDKNITNYIMESSLKSDLLRMGKAIKDKKYYSNIF